MKEDRARVNVVVLGKVQGVFFRASTLEQAQGLNLSGWVKNLPDGSVEVLAEGTRISLEQLVEWCKTGPSTAEVSETIVRWGTYRDEFRTFKIED